MNIYDIAREAGVSIATVSRVLNHKDTVRADTRAKVEKVLKRCNYAPSAIAQGMVSKSLHTVAVLTVDIRIPIMPAQPTPSSASLAAEGTRSSSATPAATGRRRCAPCRLWRRSRWTASFWSARFSTPSVRGQRWRTFCAKCPVVLANGTLALPDAYSVMVDDCRGVEMAVEHLVKTGRRNLYYIKDKAHRQRRRQGEGLPLRDGRCRSGRRRAYSRNRRDAGGRHPRGAAAFGRWPPPDGILCGEDLTAAGVLKALLRAGIRVPEETAVVGYDNSTYARLCEPELTSVDNKPEQVALLCVQLLQSRIEHGEDYSSVTLQPELVQRQSS